MKTLYIVRHAKSSWDYPDLSDQERPLIEKGIKRTKLVIDFLNSNNVCIDLIISSHAVRAYETAKLIAFGLHYPENEIQKSTGVYQSNVDSLINHLFGLSNKVKSLMMVGHNPTFTSFANYFMDKKIDWLATSGIVCIEFNTEKWEDIMLVKKNTKFVITPKLVKEQNKRK